jgi:hypothetical protein
LSSPGSVVRLGVGDGVAAVDLIAVVPAAVVFAAGAFAVLAWADDRIGDTVPTAWPWSSYLTSGACDGACTGSLWLNDGLPARPATAGTDAAMTARAAADAMSKRFMGCS